METRICKKCKVEKSIDSFKNHLARGRRDRLRKCKACVNEEDRLRGRTREGREKEWLRKKERYKKLKEIGGFTERQLEQLEKRKTYNREYSRKRRVENTMVKVSCNMRSRIRKALKRGLFKKTKRLSEYIGCPLEELKIFLEGQFSDKMNWYNYGSYWSIDHIIPLSFAENEEEFFKLNHYTNLRPLEHRENLSKNNRMSSEDISLYKERVKRYASGF